ncbi:MAG: hypothetical protein E7181_00700 [Erysipelotrichaceae bacterium]|nr:hypothetical protein [Erysipelotrichaceae bacterium]
MKYGYYQGIIKTLVNTLKQSSAPEWKEFSDNLRELVNRLDEYTTLTKEGTFKVLNSEKDYKEIEHLFAKSIEGYNKFKDLPLDENDPLASIRRRLADDINNDFLTPAFVEYQNIDITKDISLEEAMENFRSKPIPVTDDEMKQVGGNLSSRTKLTLNFDGEKVDGVFTPTSNYTPNQDYRNVIEDIAKRYPKYADYFRSLNNPAGFEATMRILLGDFIENGNFSQEALDTFLEQNYVPDDSMELFQKYHGESDFTAAYSELVKKLEPLNVSRFINTETLQLADGDNIDKRNSAMSGIAHLLDKDDSLAKARPITIEREINGQKVLIEGTFMEFAKGKDPDNLAIKDEMREMSIENYDTPTGKQSMANLQILDYICGNVDRHEGNMFYNFDPETKKLIGVQGIDNDSSFFKGNVNMDGTLNQWQGLNHLRVIDEETAVSVMALEEGPLKATLIGYGLKSEEIDAAWNRTKQLQEAIKTGKLYEKEDDIKTTADNEKPYIVIVPKDQWEKVPFDKLAHNSTNIFNKVQTLAENLAKPAQVNTKLKKNIVISENALKAKLNESGDLLRRAKSNKPIMGTSTRYKNILSGLEDYHKAASEDEKIAKLANLKRYVDIYRQEKHRDGVLDENGGLIQHLTGKDLARVNLVDEIDGYIKTVNTINGELNQAKDVYNAECKKADEINGTYRRGKYANYAKVVLDPNSGKILVNKEIFERDELFNKSMDNLTQTMNSKQALGIKNKDQRLQNEAQDYKRVRQNEVNNLKDQLSKEYNQGLIPKEYYDERIEQLNTNNFETSLEYRFAGGDPVNQAQQDFRDALLQDVNNEHVNNNNQAQEEVGNEIDINNDGPEVDINKQ